MTVAAKVGTFNTPATAISTVGFRPGVLVLWTENAVADNTWSGGLDVSYGFWCRPRPALATRAQSAWVSSNNAIATSNAAAGLNATRPVSNRNWAVGSITERVANDGFTVSYAVAAPAGTRVHYLALSTDALAQIHTLTLTPTLHGTIGQRVQVRGVGFTPSAVLVISQLLATSTSKTLGFGVAGNAALQWGLGGSSKNAVNPSNTDRTWSEDSLINLVDETGAVACRAKLVGYVADGFDLEIVTPPTASVTVYALCLGNILAKAVVQAKPTGAAPAAQSIAAGFAPKAVIFGGTHQTATGQAINHRGFLGAHAGAVNAAGAWTDTTAITPTNTKGIARIDVAAIKADNATPAVDASTAATLTTTGVDLSWTPNDAVAARFGALLIGNLKHSLGGDAITETSVTSLPLWQPTLLVGNEAVVATLVEGSIRPVNILGGDAVVETEVLSRLALRNRLGGQAIVDVLALGRVALKHTLAGVANVPIVAESFVWLPTPLRGDVVVETASDGRVALAHRLGGAGVLDTLAESYFVLELPLIPTALPGQMPGTVNWHINPGAEDGLEGWTSVGGGTAVTEEFITVWEGGRSAKVVTPGSAVGEGVVIESASGTQLTGEARLVWGSVYAAGSGTVLESWVRAVYTDGSHEDGDHEVAPALTTAPNWQRLVPPPLPLNPAKVLNHAEMMAITTTATAATFYVDGAQFEEEHGGGGPTPWTSGAYGGATGVWAGPPNRSVSYRQPIVMQTTTAGHGGQVEVEAKLYRMTWDNQIVEDITHIVLQGAVSCDPERDVTWTFDCTLTHDGWSELEPNFDWVAPFVTVRYPDGRESTGQLGLYFVVPSKAEFEEHRGTVTLSAFDPLWLLARQGLARHMVAGIGPDRSAFIRQILDEAVLTGGLDEPAGVPARYFIPNSGSPFHKKHEWDHDENRLEIANDLAESGGLYPLWTSAAGFITTRARGEGRLKHRTPVRAWAANVPSGFVPVVNIPNLAKLGHEVIGRVPVTPKAFDLFDEILLTNDDPTLGRIRVKAGLRKRNDKHPRKAGNQDKRNERGEHDDDDFTSNMHKKRRARRKKIHARYLDDAATAVQVATALADELSVRAEYVSLAVLPDPSVALVRETVSTAVWDVAGNPVAVGHWAVGRVNYALWPATPTMTMDLSRIYHGADDVDIELEESA